MFGLEVRRYSIGGGDSADKLTKLAQAQTAFRTKRVYTRRVRSSTIRPHTRYLFSTHYGHYTCNSQFNSMSHRFANEFGCFFNVRLWWVQNNTVIFPCKTAFTSYYIYIFFFWKPQRLFKSRFFFVRLKSQGRTYPLIIFVFLIIYLYLPHLSIDNCDWIYCYEYRRPRLHLNLIWSHIKEQRGWVVGQTKTISLFSSFSILFE